jgi:hypothetical protein
MNLAKLLEGPAVVIHRGQRFHFKGGLSLAPTADTFGVETDAHGVIDNRHLNNALALTGTPVGAWTADQLGVLYRWQDAQIGQLVTPRYDVSAVDTVADTITLLGPTNGAADALKYPRLGCPVRLSSDTTLPAPLVTGTLYYLGRPDAATPWLRTVHATEAQAIAGTDLINLADAGTGDHYLIEQEPLVIHTTANRKITFHNGALVAMPPAIHTATATLLGQVGFAAFRTEGAAWSGANSLYSVTKELLVDVPPLAADIRTQEYAGTWGAAPWDAFKFRGPVTLTPTLATEPVGTDGRGDLGLKITGVSAAASGIPEGFTEAQMLDILGMQGGAVARGATKTRANLVISGTGVHTTLYNAAATALPQTFAATGPRAGELAWIGARSPGSPAFRVGTAAPA